jgi:transcription antitermination factor NusG
MNDEKELIWLLLHTFAGQEPVGAEDVWQTCMTAKKKTAVRSIAVLPFTPGHLLIRAESDAWGVIRQAKRITGFAGVGKEPTPLEDADAQRLLAGRR